MGRIVAKLDIDSELPMSCVEIFKKGSYISICYKEHQFKSRIVSTNKPLRPVMSLQLNNIITTSGLYSFKIHNSSTLLHLSQLITDLYHKFITHILHLSISHLFTAVVTFKTCFLSYSHNYALHKFFKYAVFEASISPTRFGKCVCIFLW